MTNFRGPVNSRLGFKVNGEEVFDKDGNLKTVSHVVKFAGKHTTAGGSASEAITVTGVEATDLVFVVLETAGNTPRTILTSKATANTITVVFSGDPSTDHIVSYQVLRATA
jgi:hypothetical protein